jgi:carboxyl-terminal processing protease
MFVLSTLPTWEAFALGLADVAAKGALLFAAAGVVSLIMVFCRSSAAARHFVWLLAMMASLAIPILGWFLPSWTIQMPVAQSAQSPVNVAAQFPPALAELNAAFAQGNPPSTEAARASDAAPLPRERQGLDSRADATPSPVAVDDGLPWQPAIVLAWAIGMVAMFMPVVLGSLSLRRLRSSSRPAADGRALGMLATIRAELGIKRGVTLLVTDRREIPMTWGLWRPTILLPEEAESWSSERLRAVLLHESAHVARWDSVAQIVAQLARAAYWYNPLAWLAAQRLRREQEKACDDRVLRAGLPAVDYAEHLLAVATRRPLSRFTPAVALGMASVSRMERRLRSILDANCKRSALSRPQASLATAAACGLLVPLASATLSFQTRADEPSAAKKEAAKKESEGRSSSERFADLQRLLLDQYVTRPNEERVLGGAIKGMVESLNDPYSEFLPADRLADLERQVAGKLTGIGAQLEMQDGRLTIVTPLEGSPALAAGIKPRDVILEIDGQPTEGIAIADAVKRILGEKGTKVRLKVRRPSGETTDLNIERGPIVLRSVKGFKRGGDQRWEFMLDREQKIGYVAVSQLGPDTPGELKEAIEGLQKAGLKGLILDLRFSPGGLLNAAHETASLFLGEATVVTISGRDGSQQAFKSDGKTKLGDFPLIVLVNEQTASATEVLAGALKDNDRAILVGTRTFGKGSIQSLIKLDNSAGAIRLTTAFYHSPSGRNIDRRPGEAVWGVDPSDGYFVPMTQEATDQLSKRRAQREIIGQEVNEGKATAERLTPASIATDQSDPQLAAALRSLTAKIASGEFERVGQSAAAAQEYAQRRMEVQRRRDALTKSLEQLDREWKSLERETK